jgi:hypothetical protein
MNLANSVLVGPVGKPKGPGTEESAEHLPPHPNTSTSFVSHPEDGASRELCEAGASVTMDRDASALLNVG